MSETNIDITPNGPYIVKKLNKLTNSNKELETKEVVALCRCGSSKNKPFCDGTHAKINFDGKKDRTETIETNEFEGKDITIDATKDTKELDAASNRVLKQFNKGKINL